MSFKKIYFYSTNTYYNYRKKHGDTPWIKIGATDQKDVMIRVKQQDGTSNPEPLELLYEIDIPSNKSITDKDLHKFLEQNGYYKVRDNREFFEIELDDAKKLTQQFLLGKKKLHSFKPRKEQQEAIDKAVNYFQKGGKEFLLGALMRFGKTFTAYEIMKGINAKKVLIITWRPSDVKDEWRKDLDHVDFADYDFVDLKEQEPSIEDYKIYFTSYQLYLSRKWPHFKKTEFDLVIFDEAHFGGFSQETQNFK